MADFILELGIEELPARFLASAANELGAALHAALQKAGVASAAPVTAATPRRLVVLFTGLPDVSPMYEEIVTGPPVRAAYDSTGQPTKAAEGFAKTHGVALTQTFVQHSEKGEYLAAKKQLGGEAVPAILARVCPALIAALSFPKKMHWSTAATAGFTFARPLRWLLALWNTDVVPFTVDTIHSGRLTYGHRVHGAGPFTVAQASDYLTLISEQGFVLPFIHERRERIVAMGDALAQEVDGHIVWNASLLDEVQGLCEYPIPLLGKFDEGYLEVPREVLLTSMEMHQKSFGVAAEDGSLTASFLTVLNLEPQNFALVRQGWERVLRARLEDARFFWHNDLAAGFDQWLTALDSVTFLAPLGSMGDKSRRLESLCQWLAEALGLSAATVLQAGRAGRLAKADLVSDMVNEFDTLQGIMGGIYAQKWGEDHAVSHALKEQYLPSGPESAVPVSQLGAILSLADKLDTLVGCFGLGMVPTGTADPYALRRCALGIARILQETAHSYGWRLPVRAMFVASQSMYTANIVWKVPADNALLGLMDFFEQRLKNLYISAGAETLLVEAVLAADSNAVWAVDARLHALQAFSRETDFADAVLTFKRVANIIRKQAQDAQLTGVYQADLLHEPAEQHLATMLESLAPRFELLWEESNFAALFALLRELRPAVDAFFAAVMVMDEDIAKRQNRLNLLYALLQRFGRLADFNALQM